MTTPRHIVSVQTDLANTFLMCYDHAAVNMHTVPLSPTLAATRLTSERTLDIGQVVVEALEQQKADDVLTIELNDASVVADLLVIASGRSRRHVSAIAQRVASDLRSAGLRPARPEGTDECTWILIDAGQIVIHIFTAETRTLYNLERLWSTRSLGTTSD